MEARAEFACNRRFLHQDVPVQQQVVVVQQLLRLLGVDIGAKQLRELVAPLIAPWVVGRQRIRERAARVHPMGVDGEAGVLARKAFRLLGVAQFLAFDVDEVGCITAINHRETGIKAQHLRVFAQQPVADGMKCAGPQHACRIRMKCAAALGVFCCFLKRRLGDALGTLQHFLRGPAREGEQRNAFR